MPKYELVSHWYFTAPIECIWDALNAWEDWPKWWRYVLAVEELERLGNEAPGDGLVLAAQPRISRLLEVLGAANRAIDF